ncbi:hypothetical protein D3C78_1017770 [compost metagenome]
MLDVGLALFAFEVGVVHFGAEVAGGYGVDANAVARQFQRHHLGQLHHAGLGGAVHGLAEAGAHAEDRRDVDDAARAAGLVQALGGALGDAPDAVQVGGDHVAPVVLADVQAALAVGDAGIVQHHVYYAEGGLGGIEGGFDGGSVGDVQRHADRLAAGGADFLLDLGEAVGTAGAQHHAAACAGGRARQMGTDAAGGTGDQDGLAGQGEVGLLSHAGT